MNVASIDAGSNSIILLIAEVNKEQKTLHRLKNYYTTPRISKDLIDSGYISDDKIQEVLGIFSEFARKIADFNCEKVFLIGTNAFRVAKNSDYLRDIIKSKFNWELEIISGEEEARLSYLGTLYNLDKKSSKIIIDIGGGSTEFIIGNGNYCVSYRKSFEIGVVTLTERYFRTYPPTMSEIEEATVALERIFAELRSINIPNCFDLIGVAGTPTTLSSIKNNDSDFIEEKVDNSILSLEEIEEIIGKISKMKTTEISLAFGKVVEGREDLLLAGGLILTKLMKIINGNKLIVSTKGLRYGIIVDRLILSNK